MVVVSGTVGEEAAVKCLHIGETDYLLKHHLEAALGGRRADLVEAFLD